jgi:hypothetical protein
MENPLRAFQSHSSVADGQLFTFLLPNTTVLPERFYTASPTQFLAALVLAESILKEQDSLTFKDHENKQLHQIKLIHQKEIDKLQKEHAEVKQDIERQYQHDLRNVENQRKSLLKQITDLEIHLQEANTSADTIRLRFQEEAERRVAQKDSDLQHLIQHLRQELDRERNERKESESKLLALQTVRTNSSRKGREGEKQFETLCAENKGWNLTYSGKTGHAADYVASIHGLQVRFEVKKYNYTVPTKEMEKFRRDLQEHPETDVGIFVSMETHLTAIQEIHVEYTPTHQAIVWIPQLLQHDIDSLFQWMDLTIQLVKPYRKILQEKTKDKDFATLKEKVERVILLCQSCVRRLTENTKQLEIDRRACQDRFDTLVKNQGAFVASLHYEIQLMLSFLTGQDSVVQLDDSDEKPTKTGRKSRVTKKEAKSISSPSQPASL